MSDVNDDVLITEDRYISDVQRGIIQAAKVAKAAYMLRHNDPEAAELLYQVIISPFNNG